MRTVTRHAPRGMVASVDHLASVAGLRMLHQGGTAADAAVAAAAVLAVTSPHLCGMGGDLFALVDAGDGPPVALNASGRAGSGADAERLRREGHATMPFRDDIRAATVPGCVDGWISLHERFGALSLATVLRPAIGYAADGFPASPALAFMVEELRGVAGAEDLYGTRGRRTGELVRRPGVALALEAVATNGRAGFYRGPFGQGLLDLGDGEYTADDLDRVQADWVAPLSVRVWDHDVWTIPPNSQGYLVLLGLAIASGLPLPDKTSDPAWAHLLVETARAAAHDRLDVLAEGADVSGLLTDDATAERRALVDATQRAQLRLPVDSGDTTYLCAVDRDRMGVSLIQSNAKGFGCRLFEPATGIGLHNRGLGFSLVVGHAAEYAPGRRPPHTLSPTLVTRDDGALRAVVGTMGGDAQPQILLQVLTRLLRHGQSPGSAIGAPRWKLEGSDTGFHTWVDADAVRVDVEEDAGWGDGLRALGHRVETRTPFDASFGHAHAIEVDGPVLAGAADPRALVEAAVGY